MTTDRRRFLATGAMGVLGAALAPADYLFGVTPKMAALPEFDANGRYVSPEIKSANLKLVI